MLTCWLFCDADKYDVYFSCSLEKFCFQFGIRLRMFKRHIPLWACYEALLPPTSLRLMFLKIKVRRQQARPWITAEPIVAATVTAYNNYD